jgi:hypothetical protein
VRGVPSGSLQPDDTWVRATLIWRPPPDGDDPSIIEADLIELEIIDDPPDSPYETPF